MTAIDTGFPRIDVWFRFEVELAEPVIDKMKLDNAGCTHGVTVQHLPLRYIWNSGLTWHSKEIV